MTLFCLSGLLIVFQSTYLYKVRPRQGVPVSVPNAFQSTYLYKVRQCLLTALFVLSPFQSTYLYKVRHDNTFLIAKYGNSFNPRTYIRYDKEDCMKLVSVLKFQSTYLYKVRRHGSLFQQVTLRGFNPRTYIRYDGALYNTDMVKMVSIHVPI